MKVFIDTNVLIDFLAVRHQHYQAAAVLFELATVRKLNITYSTLSVANAFYILRKYYPNNTLTEVFESQRSIAEICSVTAEDTYNALSEKWDDVEDSIQNQSAISSNCEFILTRNVKDFSKSSLNVMTPEEFLDKYFD